MNAIRRHALAAPKLKGLFIARHALLTLEDGDVELLLGNGEPLRRRDQLPRKRDGIALEVIAKAEVAQHLEKSMVPAGEADVFQIVVLAAGAHALLRSGGTVVVTPLHAKKYIFELVHARVGKQQCGVVRRNQRGGVDATVPLRGKKTQKGFPYLRTRAVPHRSSLSGFYASEASLAGGSDGSLRRPINHLAVIEGHLAFQVAQLIGGDGVQILVPDGDICFFTGFE